MRIKLNCTYVTKKGTQPPGKILTAGSGKDADLSVADARQLIKAGLATELEVVTVTEPAPPPQTGGGQDQTGGQSANK